MNNSNSFAENMAQLTENTSDVLAIMEGINESLHGNDSEVKVSDDLALPSYNNIVKRVNRAEDTISKFVQGKGVIETNDGTFRKIKVSTVSRPPQNIGMLTDVSTFTINPNWFFESLQYPKCVITLDLKDNIEDDSDRVFVNRVIIDSTQTVGGLVSVVDFFNSNIKNVPLTYASLIKMLEENKIKYSEDKDTIYLPLTYEKHKGSFTIEETKLIKNEKGESQVWYYLDTLMYSIVDEDGLETSNGHMLTIGDLLRFNDSLYKVTDIVASQGRVMLDYAVGFETIGNGDVLDLYNEPFSEKKVEIGIGINEIDIIYVKGVNENYNLMSREWSDPVAFYTNDLIMEGTVNTTFKSYYTTSVSDFGSDWIAQARERRVNSFDGKQPYAPTLNLADLKVVQINTQLDATLDKETYNSLTTQITSTKSNIMATRNTIATNKDRLIQSTSQDERTNYNNLINKDTESLNSLTTQYNSLVEELNTLLTESGAINYTPKYHVRGFFAIPEPRYSDEENKQGEQDIIGFEIQYRYLHTDETGIKLDTYEYSDTNKVIQTGVFSDWNTVTSTLLAKTYNEETGLFEWATQSTSDGTQININQIDIPITNGEKVEIKVRSISEAGYPYNPLKSEWSNSVIVSFPENLTNDDSVTTILETVKNDMTAVVLQETLSAAGVYTHFADSNSKFKHQSQNVSYTETVTDSSTKITTLLEVSVQEKIKSMSEQIAKIDTISKNQEKISETLTTLTQKLAEVKTFIGYTNVDVQTADGDKPSISADTTQKTIADVLLDLYDLFKNIYDVLPSESEEESEDDGTASGSGTSGGSGGGNVTGEGGEGGGGAGGA